MAKKKLSFAEEMKAMARKATLIDAAVESGELDSAIFSGSPDSWKTPDVTVATLETVDKQTVELNPQSPTEIEEVVNCSPEPFKDSSMVMEAKGVKKPSKRQLRAVETEPMLHDPLVVCQKEQPANSAGIRNRTQEALWYPRTKMQRELASYLRKLGTHITTLGIISIELNIGINTLRSLLRTFNEKGLVKSKKHYSEDGKQGLYIEVVNLTNIPSSYEEALFGVNKELHESNIQASIPHDFATGIANEVGLLDKQKEFLATTPSYTSPLLKLSEEDIGFYWSDLAKIGFGTGQIRQIHERLEKLGRVVDAELSASITQGLTHANAALVLSDGILTDHKGTPIANPRAYIFASLARDGYYTAPKGYLSPNVCRLKDEAEQNRLFAEAQKELNAQKTAKLEAESESTYCQWREGLSEEDIAGLVVKAPSHAKKGIGFEKWLKLTYYPTVKNAD